MHRTTERNRAKRPVLVLGIALSIVALAASTVFALASGLPDHDTFVTTDESEKDNTHDGESLKASASAGGLGACEPIETIYLQWDLSELSGTGVDTATLTLTATYATGTGSAQLSLYETGDGWNEDTLILEQAPAISASIQTISAPPAGTSLTTITFSNPALVAYINDQAADDDVASFALRFSDCSEGLTYARFADEESGSDGPYLLMLNSNAVRLHSLRTTGGESKWLAVAGLSLIAFGSALVVQSVWQRRTTLREVKRSAPRQVCR